MEEKLRFDLISPDNKVFSGQVDQVIIPGVEGQIGVLPRHAPFMSTLKSGLVTILKEKQKNYYFITGGLADISPEGLILLAEQVWSPKDHHQKQAEITELEKQLPQIEKESERTELTQRIETLKVFIQSVSTLN